MHEGSKHEPQQYYIYSQSQRRPSTGVRQLLQVSALAQTTLLPRPTTDARHAAATNITRTWDLFVWEELKLIVMGGAGRIAGRAEERRGWSTGGEGGGGEESRHQ